MSTDKDWETYKSPVDKLGLTEAERYDFQSRRYGTSFCVIGVVRTGRMILTNPLREPIAVINDLDQLRTILFEEQRKSYQWQRGEAERRATLAKQVKHEDADLNDLMGKIKL